MPGELASVHEIEPCPWNPNVMDQFMYAKELASISKFGMVSPIIVREYNGGYQIIDGEHRLKGAVELGFERVPIWNLGRLDDVAAKELTIVLNETRGTADREKLSSLLSDLLSSETTQDLLQVLPFSQTDLEAVLGSSSFDWEQMEVPESQYRNDSRLGWVERTYRMPADSARVVDEAVRHVQAEGDDLPDWKALELIAADYMADYLVEK